MADMNKKLDLWNYEYCKKILARKKQRLLGIYKNSTNYSKYLKSYFRLLLLVKAHALALDTQKERNKLLNLLMSEMRDFKMY